MPSSIPVRLFTILLILCLAFPGGVSPGGLTGVSSDTGRLHAEEAGQTKQHQNRLANESSPYLLLHAHNPVDWYPWGPEALAKAKKENKLIFLSVGYSSCYWCHVMERKVFSDPEIAAYMNEHFVNVKIDREERPDLDQLYMTALSVYHQAIGAPQAGGWPLSMFLTPDTKPLLGGTYFPPTPEGGLIAFPDLAKRIATAWRDDQQRAQKQADGLTEILQRALRDKPALNPVAVDQQLIDGVRKAVAEEFDPEYGGFGFDAGNAKQPKFPTPSKLALLQYQAAKHNDSEAAEMLKTTLDHMAAGGIWDHLGGGFHRYSTDRYWHVPHFEKMLYDNAQLAEIYIDAYQRTDSKEYREIAEQIFAFVTREMTGKEGGFYSALDAETEAVEGKSYLWTPKEVTNSLSARQAKLFNRAYGLDGKPDLEGEHVLRAAVGIDELAREFKSTPEDVTRQLALARETLLAVRAKREAPLTDDKVMADWNGLMIAAFAKGGAALGHPEYIQAAEKAARFVLDTMRDQQGRLLHSYRNGKAKFRAYADDYAFLAHGLLALYQATGDEAWLKEARRLTDLQLELFWDPRFGGCFFTAHDHEELLARSKQIYDSARPSGNSVTIRNLIRLAAFTGEPGYREQAREALENFAPQIKQAPLGTAHLAVAAAEFIDQPKFDVQQRAKDDGSATLTSQPVIRLVSARQNSSPREQKKKKKKPEVVKGKAYLSFDKLPAGKKCQVLVVVQIDDKWHINANPAGDDYAIATEFTLKSKNEAKLGKVYYPKGKKMKVPGSDKPLPVYTKRAVLRSTIEVPASAAGKKEELELNIRYQACDDRRCLRPMTLKLKVPIAVAGKGETVKPINDKLFRPKKKDEDGKSKTRN